MPARSAEEVLEFWFAETTRPQWFARSEAFDARVREALAPLHLRAARGELDDWAADPRGALALVLLLDQAPRNLHRGSADAFACDARAREIARAVVDAGLDRGLEEVERVFLYLPFEHSESLADQDRSVALMGSLGTPLWTDYAERHRAVIARFGRFPHRNAIVGRESTPEELEFLTQPGSSF
jgi:uncharacterized protein (DUF924 family)